MTQESVEGTVQQTHIANGTDQKAMGVLIDRSGGIHWAALHVGCYLRHSSGSAHDSVIAFLATIATAEESSLVQQKGGRKIQVLSWCYDLAMTALFAESHSGRKNVLTRVVVNLINRRNQ